MEEPPPRQQHHHEQAEDEACTVASPSTFLESEFHMTMEKNRPESNDGDHGAIPWDDEENERGRWSQERALWDQVASIRQEVCAMRENLNQLSTRSSTLLLVDGDTATTLGGTNSRFSVSTRSHHSFSSEGTLDTDDEDPVIEGILVAIPSSVSSSSSSYSSATASSSCVSSLGLGGHETTNPLQISNSFRRPAGGGNRAPRPRRPRGEFRRQDTNESSVGSLTALQEIGNFAKLLYFFALEFPIHLLSFLSESSTAPDAKARPPPSAPRRSRRFLPSLLAISVIGCAVLVREQCQRRVAHPPPIPRASQSCVTTTAASDGPMATNSTGGAPNHPSDLLVLAPSVLSVRHPTTRSKRPRRSMTARTTAGATIQLLHGTADDVLRPSNRTRPIRSGDGSPNDAALPQMQVKDRRKGKGPGPIVDLLRRQGQEIAQRLAKNNRKMWHRYPDPHSTLIDSPKGGGRDRIGAELLETLRRRGRDMAQKPMKNNHKMWKAYPTMAPSRERPKRRGRDKGEGPVASFLRKTGGMWSGRAETKPNGLLFLP